MLDYESLKLIWWVIIGTLLIGFAITDGMDMGVGMLLPFLGKSDSERRVIINTVAPHWDGNQVWFITAGGAIFAAWPMVYAAAFSGFYLAMLLALFGLFCRPVGFDYRSKLENTEWRNAWDWALFAGAFIPPLIFGIAFGNLLQGVPFHLDNFMMPHYDASFIWALFRLLNPFALLAGVISVVMLAVHGAAWLQLRSDGVLAERAKTTIGSLAPAIAVLFTLAGVWLHTGIAGYRIVSALPHDALPNPLAKEVVRAHAAWFDIFHHQPVAWLAPLAGLIGPFVTRHCAQSNRPVFAFIASAASIAGIIGTAGLSMFPFIMPSSTVPNSSLTIWDATSSHLTMTIMFWAVVIFLPIVLAYTVWAYVQMWGKVTEAHIAANSHQVY